MLVHQGERGFPATGAIAIAIAIATTTGAALATASEVALALALAATVSHATHATPSSAITIAIAIAIVCGGIAFEDTWLAAGRVVSAHERIGECRVVLDAEKGESLQHERVYQVRCLLQLLRVLRQ